MPSVPAGPLPEFPPPLLRVRKATLGVVFLTIFLDLVGFGMFIPILANVAREVGASNAQAAALSAYFSLGTLISVVVLGRASDKVGRRPLLLGTILLSSIVQLATGFAGNYALLVAARFVAGCASGNISVAQATIADLTRPEERGRFMVIIGLAFGGGFAVGPALGALVSRAAPENTLLAVAIVAAVLNLVNFVLALVKLPETHIRFARDEVRPLVNAARGGASQTTSSPTARATTLREDFRVLWREAPFRTVLFLQFLQVFGFVGVETILPVVLKDAYSFDDVRIYDAFIVLGIAVLLVNAAISRRVLRQVGEVRTLNLGQAFLALGIFLVAFAAPVSGLLHAALVILALGTALANPALSALVSRLAPADAQGFAFGTSQTLGALARIVGPLTMGVLYDSLRGAPSLYVSAGLMALGVVSGIGGLTVVRQRFALERKSPTS